MSIITEFLIQTVATMSPQQREDMYLTLASTAEDNGRPHEAEQWLYHAEKRTTWRGLVEEKTNVYTGT